MCYIHHNRGASHPSAGEGDPTRIAVGTGCGQRDKAQVGQARDLDVPCSPLPHVHLVGGGRDGAGGLTDAGR